MDSPRRESNQRNVLLLLSLALLSTMAPFAIDMYLPAFPAMAEDLDVPAQTIQLTLTTFFVGVAIGQLVLGPLSDRIGRKPPLVVGSAVCLVASAAAAMAPNAEVLLVARLVQGFSGAAGMVIARAIVADLYRGVAAAKMFSLLALVGGIAPVVAPLIGGALAIPTGWRGVMWSLAGITALMLAAVVFVIPETHGRAARAEARAHLDDPAVARRRHIGMLDLVRRPGFTANALIMTFGFVVLMGYVSASPFVFQTIMGLGVLGSGVLFAINSAGIFIGSSINIRLVDRFGQHAMMRVGLVLFAVGVAILALQQALGLHVYVIEVPLILFTTALGFTFGNSVALALGHAADARGAGSAFVGASQFLAGAFVAPAVGVAGPASAVPLLVVVTLGTLGVLVCYVISRRAGVAEH
ncbi:multidrug effflux MFS transporter [Ammonicoccus fulvus]|uniref:Multidrug effflux MFS transporter n=1 Tax=Ammonicoccus fulvus TaxID=3138240 RepID=A0ABZ3FP13_9ACTN